MTFDLDLDLSPASVPTEPVAPPPVVKTPPPTAVRISPPPAVKISAPKPATQTVTHKPIATSSEVQKAVSAMVNAPVEVLAVDLNLARAASKEGVLVDIEMHTWSPTRRLTPADRGISDVSESALQQARSERVILLPESVRKQYSAAKTRMHRAMTENGFRIRGYRGCFVPAKSWPAFKRGFEKGQADLEATLTDLCDNIETHTKTIEAALRQLAPRAWTGHRADWTNQGTAQPGTYALVDTPPEEFIEEFVLRFLCHIPPVEEIRARTWAQAKLNALYIPEVSAMLSDAQEMSALSKDLRDSLSRQNRDLPMAFAESCAASIAGKMGELLIDINKSAGTRTSGIARSINNVRTKLKGMREFNLTKDPRVEHILSQAEYAIQKAEARAAGSGVPIAMDFIVNALTEAVSKFSDLFILDEVGE